MKAKVRLVGHVDFEVETGGSLDDVSKWMHELNDGEIVEILSHEGSSKTFEVV